MISISQKNFFFFLTDRLPLIFFFFQLSAIVPPEEHLQEKRVFLSPGCVQQMFLQPPWNGDGVHIHKQEMRMINLTCFWDLLVGQCYFCLQTKSQKVCSECFKKGLKTDKMSESSLSESSLCLLEKKNRRANTQTFNIYRISKHVMCINKISVSVSLLTVSSTHR